ncbi:hypothetical protein KC363_g3131 [Hortaea werneckii]|nr:hypothetical protein KC361_g1209 [Hortaea werneckii]KAI6888609.1 hypothetical protein KC325_g1212 [Hortaea werneckii]KAI6999677.1 hypothetical protein KC359_g1602 [Hortaea werneckii]KAI7149737.1 hypothetical protein KC344_g765 [Hortaea werneckii]KAI7179386.1 hypothetical protein KC360_g872 [Hortaea werneckii]
MAMLQNSNYSNSSSGFEVPPGGIPSPPSSPDAGPTGRRRPGLKARSRSGDAAHHITEECERLFCETLRTVFLVEKDTGLETSLVMDAPSSNSNNNDGARGSTTSMAIPQHTTTKHGIPTPSPSPDTMVLPKTTGLVKEYVEVFDYVGGLQFRGFVAEKGDERALFVFFENSALGADLKPGLMALLELASSDQFNCSQLVACVGRQADDEAVHDTTRDLGWVGFELMMLDDWAKANDCLSDRWIFMGMDV